MKIRLFKFCVVALALNQMEHRLTAGAELGAANSVAITEHEKAAHAQRDASKQRAQNVLMANKAHLQRLPLPPNGFWLIDLSFGRANRETIEAVHSLLGDEAGWVRLAHNELSSDEIKTLAKSQGIFQLDLVLQR